MPIENTIKSILFYLFIVLLSICGIHSNISLSVQQVCFFFRCINSSTIADETILSNLSSSCTANGISTKDLINVIQSSFNLSDEFIALQSALLRYFLRDNDYVIILQRILCYNHIYDNGSYLLPSKEPCLTKYYRILCSNKPHPYLTEYRTFDTDYHQLITVLIHELRIRYGYSSRIIKSRKVKLSNLSEQLTNSTILTYGSLKLRNGSIVNRKVSSTSISQ